MKQLIAKLLSVLMLFTLIFTSISIPTAAAEAPYNGYNYSYWEDAVPSSIPYLPYKVIDGNQEGIGNLNTPEDMFVTDDNEIYLLDSGNNRIVVLDEHFSVIKVIDEFSNQGKADHFNKPQGIFVTEEGNIYIADTENRRVIELTNEGGFIREIGAPESDVIRAGFEYFPRKIAVDKANRIYVIGKGVYDGIIEFDQDGVFTGFTGANKVQFNVIDYFWKRIATKEQRAKMELFIPIEFNNLDLDDEGFIYTTNSEENTTQPIQRLNPTGTDVIRKEGYHEPVGDLEYAFRGNMAGTSTFTDIDVNDYGMYSALDIKRGRIFTYDEDGNLIYVFGQLGNQRGTFKTPVAIERLGDYFLVLDKGFNRITVFEPTEFGSTVNQAAMYYNQGNDAKSAEYWEKVVRLDANYEVAYIGIGKALLMDGKNKEAMEYFDNGFSRKYYSKAYKRYREEVLRENFGTIMSGLMVVILIFVLLKVYGRVWKGRVRAVAKRVN